MSLIKRWLEYKGWTPTMFAQRAGIKIASVQSLMRDNVRHQEGTLRKYAPLFDVSFSEFLAGPPGDHTGNHVQAAEPEKHAGTEMRRASEDEITRAQIIGIVCGLKGVQLGKVLGYVESLVEKKEL